jgi:hypothetical protein
MIIHMQVTSLKIFNLFVMKIIVVLGLGDCSNAQVLIDGDRYVANMTGNAHFAAAPIVEQIGICRTSVSNLRLAINAPRSDTRSDNIRIARDVLDRNLSILGAKVEEIANDPSIPDTKRVEIVHSAGMAVKNQVHPGKHKFTVKNTEVRGTVHLTAQGGANSHEWQYTTDIINFTGRIAAHTTTKANTDIRNLKKLTEYAFFHKPIVPNGDTDWEGPIILIVM